jgi:hypothetical protein
VTWMSALAREPLMRFAALGTALFLVFHFVQGRSSDDSTTIVVTRGEISQLADTFQRLNQRSPNRDELQQIIEQYVRTEILARQARALGLERDDVLIRRRLTQKLEFLLQSMAMAQAPTEDELRAFLREHSERYWVDSKTTFQHIFFSRARRGSATEAAARRCLAEIEGGHSDGAHHAGDFFLLGYQFPSTTSTEVARDFGEKFAETLEDAPLNKWSGPVESGFGWHLVFVSARVSKRLPALAEILEAVRRDWSAAHAQSFMADAYREARTHYLVRVEPTTNQVSPVDREAPTR